MLSYSIIVSVRFSTLGTIRGGLESDGLVPLLQFCFQESAQVTEPDLWSESVFVKAPCYALSELLHDVSVYSSNLTTEIRVGGDVALLGQGNKEGFGAISQ